MRAVQPDGPYDLLGMCGGAHLATEMTRAVEAWGERASFLGIVNTWGFYTISRLFYVNRWHNIARYLLGRIRDKLGGESRPAAADAAPAPVPTPRTPTQANGEEVGLNSPWVQDVGFAHRDPRRPRIASAITVFRIKPQQYWRIRDAGLGWSKQSGEVHVVPLPGEDHDDILREPNVRHIAQAIERCLTAPLESDAKATHRTPITQTGNSL